MTMRASWFWAVCPVRHRCKRGSIMRIHGTSFGRYLANWWEQIRSWIMLSGRVLYCLRRLHCGMCWNPAIDQAVSMLTSTNLRLLLMILRGFLQLIRISGRYFLMEPLLNRRFVGMCYQLLVQKVWCCSVCLQPVRRMRGCHFSRSCSVGRVSGIYESWFRSWWACRGMNGIN